MPLTYSLELPFFTKYEEQFKISGVLQFFILFLSAIVLDGGDLSQFMLLSATTYWIAVVIIMIRRNGNATQLDRLVFMWGYPAAILLTGVLRAIVPMGILRH